MRNQIRKFDRNGSFFPSIFNSYFNDNLFNNFVEGDLPATNVSETEKAFNIELSVPGFNKEDIKVEIEKNILTISAQTEEKKEEKDVNEKVLRQEFRKSSFSRRFTIPENIDTESIVASQQDGVLSITLPKQDKTLEDKIKKIEIK
ncbi:MAG: Hsp20/alpha crystallin family protein [Dysgonomonas sp.]|nr:Hsp20/alpha crystallin family protein [Dysgonomonas sp.]